MDMVLKSNGRRAPGGLGIELRWTHGSKVAVGTAYSTSSHVWYTLDAGCVTEVYYPTIDTQIRNLQFLFTDGETFLHDERRNFVSEIDCVSEAALGFQVINREKQGLYTVPPHRHWRSVPRLSARFSSAPLSAVSIVRLAERNTLNSLSRSVSRQRHRRSHILDSQYSFRG
jgi:Glucodextranase, domain N